MSKIHLAIWMLLVVLLAAGCSLLPTGKPVEAVPDILVNQYITALKAEDLVTFSEKILSSGYTHIRQDGSVEDREAYLAKLTDLFQFEIDRIQILAQTATSTATSCEIFLHWKMTLDYGPFSFKFVEVIDKTTLHYQKENGAWRLYEEAPVTKDGTADHAFLLTEIGEEGISFEDLVPVDSVPITEEMIYIWALWVFPEDQLSLTQQLRARWYSPDGELFYESPHFLTPTQVTWQYWCPMEVKDHVPASLVGKWRVEVYLNDLLKLQKDFYITP